MQSRRQRQYLFAGRGRRVRAAARVGARRAAAPRPGLTHMPARTQGDGVDKKLDARRQPYYQQYALRAGRKKLYIDAAPRARSDWEPLVSYANEACDGGGRVPDELYNCEYVVRRTPAAYNGTRFVALVAMQVVAPVAAGAELFVSYSDDPLYKRSWTAADPVACRAPGWKEGLVDGDEYEELRAEQARAVAALRARRADERRRAAAAARRPAAQTAALAARVAGRIAAVARKAEQRACRREQAVRLNARRAGVR